MYDIIYGVHIYQYCPSITVHTDISISITQLLEPSAWTEYLMMSVHVFPACWGGCSVAMVTHDNYSILRCRRPWRRGAAALERLGLPPCFPALLPSVRCYLWRLKATIIICCLSADTFSGAAFKHVSIFCGAAPDKKCNRHYLMSSDVKGEMKMNVFGR